jgi:hypothetical protein
VLTQLVDKDLFVWLDEGRPPTEAERFRASTIVADRLCGTQSDPIIRNAQEERQLKLIEEFLSIRGYRKHAQASSEPITAMQPGTYYTRMNVMVGPTRSVKMPTDLVIQPHTPRLDGFPILIEAKSAGDYANPNKRRKEEATKIRQVREAYGPDAALILFLCGYFDTGYLGYEAAEGLDWVWEHRMDDLLQLGLS